MQRLISKFEEHPVAYFCSILVGAIGLFAAVWPILTHDTVPEFVGRHQIGTALYRLVVVGGAWALGLGLVALATALVQRAHLASVATSVRAASGQRNAEIEFLKSRLPGNPSLGPGAALSRSMPAPSGGSLIASAADLAVTPESGVQEASPLALKWGGGGTRFEGISHAPSMLNVRCLLVDARWLSSQGYWATTSDTHPGGIFQKLQLERRDMHTDEGVALGSIVNMTNHLFIQGNPLEGGGVEKCRIRKPGTWRLEFQLEDVNGRTVKRALCFKWEDGKFQQPLDTCPDEQLT